MLGRLKFIIAFAVAVGIVWVAAVERNLTGKVESGLVLPPTIQAQLLHRHIAGEIALDPQTVDGE